jgi:hypothetical protein
MKKKKKVQKTMIVIVNMNGSVSKKGPPSLSLSLLLCFLCWLMKEFLYKSQVQCLMFQGVKKEGEGHNYLGNTEG